MKRPNLTNTGRLLGSSIHMALLTAGLVSLSPVFAQEAGSAGGAAAASGAAASGGSAGGSSLPSPTLGDATGEGFAPSPFRLSVEVRGGYDDNNNTAPDGFEAESAFTGVAAEYSGLFGTDRTALRLALSGGADYFTDLEEDQTQYRVRLSYDLSHKINPRFSMSFGGFAALERNPDLSTGFTNTIAGDEYFYTSNTLAFSYVWAPKFSTATRYTLNYITYPDQEALGGAGDDRIEHNIAQEFRFLWKPKTTLVAEYRYGMISYADDPSSSRDSVSHFVLAGLEHQINPRSRTYLRAGAEFREYDAFGSDSAPYVEWNTDYALGPVTSISWLNRYSIEQSYRGPGLSNDVFRTGIRFNHAFSERLKFNAAVFYSHNEYSAFVDPNVKTTVTRSTSTERADARTLNNGQPFTQPIVTKITTTSSSEGLDKKGIPTATNIESVTTKTVFPDGRTVTTTITNTSKEPTVRDFTEQTFDASVGLEYFFTPTFSAYLSYNYTHVLSDEDLNEYTRNRGYVGIRANF